MKHANLILLRALIFVQLFVFLWFIFAPDLLPDSIKWAEKTEDKTHYFYVDLVVIFLTYFQAACCAATWWPNRLAAYGYAASVVLIGVVSAFGGAASISSVDAIFGYLQALATGATLVMLYLFGFFAKSQDKE
jgi:hypothetical protein